MNTTKTHQPSPLIQLLVNFVIPIVILSRYSSQSQLGPTRAMLLALLFPVVYELYSVWKRKKVSMLSVIAIGGIVVTGAISLLGLSEGWLALRRSVPYFAVSLALLISMRFNRPLIDLMLAQAIDLNKVRKAADKQNNEEAYNRLMKTTNMLIALAFIAIGTASYVMTRIIIASATNTEAFNNEYARLRVLTFPYITVPTIGAMIGLIMYLFTRLEKISGLGTEDFAKQKPRHKK